MLFFVRKINLRCRNIQNILYVYTFFYLYKKYDDLLKYLSLCLISPSYSEAMLEAGLITMRYQEGHLRGYVNFLHSIKHFVSYLIVIYIKILMGFEYNSSTSFRRIFLMNLLELRNRGKKVLLLHDCAGNFVR